MADDLLNRLWFLLREGNVEEAIRQINYYGHASGGDVVDEMELRIAWLANRPRRPIPADVRGFVCERDDFTCGICGKPVEPKDEHLDHIVPIHLGGDDGADNLRLTHARCNLTRRYEEFDWMYPLEMPA